MNPLQNEQLLGALQWRYATKVFDPAQKIPAATWETLQQALILTPTSYGLQPYRFLVIEDPTKRAALLAHSWNQRQVTDCSHYVVFLARTEVTEADLDKWIRRLSEVRGLAVESLTGYRKAMQSDVITGPRRAMAPEWAARQTYIALGNLMTAAALLGVDTCPMEGLVPAEYDKILGLNGSGYATVMACALGYRAAGDKYANVAKVRFGAAELVKVV